MPSREQRELYSCVGKVLLLGHWLSPCRMSTAVPSSLLVCFPKEHAENVLDFLPPGRESRFPVGICEGTCMRQSTRDLETKGEQPERRACKTEMTPACTVWGPATQNVFLVLTVFEGKSITKPWHKQRVKPGGLVFFSQLLLLLLYYSWNP